MGLWGGGVRPGLGRRVDRDGGGQVAAEVEEPERVEEPREALEPPALGGGECAHLYRIGEGEGEGREGAGWG